MFTRQANNSITKVRLEMLLSSQMEWKTTGVTQNRQRKESIFSLLSPVIRMDNICVKINFEHILCYLYLPFLFLVFLLIRQCQQLKGAMDIRALKSKKIT
jgi:hypothetical protein